MQFNIFILLLVYSSWNLISKHNDYFVKTEMHDSLHSFRAHNLTFSSSFVVIDWALITSQEFPCVEFLCSSTKRGHALSSRIQTSLLIMTEDMRDLVLASKFASSNETALFPGISVRYSFLRVQSTYKRSCPAAIKRFQLRFNVSRLLFVFPAILLRESFEFQNFYTKNRINCISRELRKI